MIDMTETDSFKIWLEERGNRVTLGEIMQTHYGCEYRKHFSLLRQKGIDYAVQIHRKEPSQNLYYLKQDRFPVVFDEVGQGVFV